MIELHDVEGIARLSGTCKDGCTWLQYELDQSMCDLPDGEVYTDTCCECGKEMISGWVNMDDGSEQACNDCVKIINRRITT